MDKNDKEPKDYELAFLAREEKIPAGVLQLVRAQGGELLLEGPIEKIELAYKIGKDTSALFGYCHFRALPEAVAAIEKELKVAPGVIRTLLVTPPFVKQQSRWEGRTKARGAYLKTTPAEGYNPGSLPLSNEALEKKIEEILK